MAERIEDIVKEIVVETVNSGDTEACTTDGVREIAQEEISEAGLSEEAMREYGQEECEEYARDNRLQSENDVREIVREEIAEATDSEGIRSMAREEIDARLDRICGTIADTLAERLRQQLVAFMIDAVESDIRPGDRPDLDVTA